ncbi:unnamed protein product [Caenorhabditis sp. 36 PRJEB53466]|nr:unnamed protein product [Caenorhabditis sp. 36 PRJEB53466]
MQRILRPFETFGKTATNSVCIWLNGEPTAIEKRAEELWNGAKYRVAADGALNEIEKRAETVEWPHVVAGDFDSKDERIETRNATIVHLPDQMKTDLTKSIEFCLEQNERKEWTFDRIVILGGLNGRFDHTMSTLSTLAMFVAQSVPVFVLDSRNFLMAVPEGEMSVDVDLQICSKMCGVIPIAQTPTRVTSNGLKYEMTDLPLAFGHLISSSNELAAERIQLKANAPLLFTIELISEHLQ